MFLPLPLTQTFPLLLLLCSSPSSLFLVDLSLSTLRAFDAEERFNGILKHRLDDFQRVFLAFWVTTRWFTVRLDTLSSMVSGAAGRSNSS